MVLDGLLTQDQPLALPGGGHLGEDLKGCNGGRKEQEAFLIGGLASPGNLDLDLKRDGEDSLKVGRGVG